MVLPPVTVLALAAAPETRPPLPAIALAKLLSTPRAVTVIEPASRAPSEAIPEEVSVAEVALATVAPAATRPALALLATELCRVVPPAITATAPVTASTVPTSTRLVTRLALVAVVTVELRPIKPPTEPEAVAETVSRPDCWARLPDTVRLAAVIVTFFVEAATAAATLASATEAPMAAVPALMPCAPALTEGSAVARMLTLAAESAPPSTEAVTVGRASTFATEPPAARASRPPATEMPSTCESMVVVSLAWTETSPVVVILLLLMLAPVVLVTVSPVPAPPPATATPKPEAVPAIAAARARLVRVARSVAVTLTAPVAERPPVPLRLRIAAVTELAITLSAAATARENEAPPAKPKAAATEAAPVSTLRDDVSRAATVTAPAVIVSPGPSPSMAALTRAPIRLWVPAPAPAALMPMAPPEIATEPATTVALMV